MKLCIKKGVSFKQPRRKGKGSDTYDGITGCQLSATKRDEHVFSLSRN